MEGENQGWSLLPYRLRSASNRSDALAVILFHRFSKRKEQVQQIDREREREREGKRERKK